MALGSSPLRRRVKSLVYRAMPRTRLVTRGRAGRREVALTFDDGPDDLTPRYLDVLDELHARATFFVVGTACEKYPELVREYVKRGHQIASHGYDHTRFSNLSWRALRDQLDRSSRLLGPQGTPRPWVRPPYGDVDARVLAQLLASGSFVAMWSLDSHDYEVKDPDALAMRCAPSQVAPGEVILLHEGQTWTIEALPKLVGNLRSAGYEFVTMADLLS
jgi:peptidoglycan-N-acetylglucosamine deacetylase